MKILSSILLSLFTTLALAFEPKDIKQVYYLLASAKGFSRSAFGHGFIRLSTHESPHPSDVVIEFVADVPSHQLNYLKAIGLFSSYDRAVISKPYSTVKREINYSQNRDLISYQLKLTTKQKLQFAQALKDLLEVGSYQNYTFFWKNCSQAIASLLKDESQVNASGISSIIPNEFPHLLRKNDLLTDVLKTDLSLSNRRVALYKKYQETISQYGNFSALTEDSLTLRVNAFVKLANASQGQQEIAPYLQSAIFYETKVNRLAMIDLIRGDKSLKSISLSHESLEVNSKLTGLAITHKIKVRDTFLSFQDKKFYLNYALEIRGKKTGKSILKKHYRVVQKEVHDLTLKHHQDIYMANHFIGVLVPPSLDSTQVKLSHAWPVTNTLVDEGRIIFETDLLIQPLIPGKVLDESSLNQLFNNFPNMPACFALVDLQKNLLEKAVFFPDLPALSDEKNISFLKDLMGDHIVVIPGFKDIASWTSSLPKKEAMEIIYQYQQENYSSISGAIGNYFDGVEIDLAGINYISALARKGVYTPLFFKTKYGFGHAFLVLDVFEIEDQQFSLKVYNPNKGIDKDIVFFDAKKGIIKTDSYGSNKAFLVERRITDSFFYMGFQNDKKLNRYIKEITKKYQKNSFRLGEILSGY